MPVPLDFVQRMREALVAILDTAADVVALTGRASGNIVPFDDPGEHPLPLLAYRVVSATPTGGIGDEREFHVTLRAFALDEGSANALVALADRLLGWSAFNALPTPIDLYRLRAQESRAPVEPDPESETFAADVDLVLVATNPTP